MLKPSALVVVLVSFRESLFSLVAISTGVVHLVALGEFCVECVDFINHSNKVEADRDSVCVSRLKHQPELLLKEHTDQSASVYD